METATGTGAECAHVTVFWPMKSCRPMSPRDSSENKKKKLFSLYSDNNHFQIYNRPYSVNARTRAHTYAHVRTHTRKHTYTNTRTI